MDSRPIYGELKQTLTYLLESHKTDFYLNEEAFQWSQRNFNTKQKEDIYWQRIEIFGSMLSFLSYWDQWKKLWICTK